MGQAASELQHVANQLQGLGPEEKKFLENVFEGKVEEAKNALMDNPNFIYARTRDWYNAWHLAARAGNMEVRVGQVAGWGPAGTYHCQSQRCQRGNGQDTGGGGWAGNLT